MVTAIVLAWGENLFSPGRGNENLKYAQTKTTTTRAGREEPSGSARFWKVVLSKEVSIESGHYSCHAERGGCVTSQSC